MPQPPARIPKCPVHNVDMILASTHIMNEHTSENSLVKTWICPLEPVVYVSGKFVTAAAKAYPRRG